MILPKGRVWGLGLALLALGCSTPVSKAPRPTVAEASPSSAPAAGPTATPTPATDGQVLDAQHRPLAGAAVRALGGTLAATTGADGHFTLAIPDGQALDLEADGPDDTKALARGVRSVKGLVLQLGPTGSLKGQLTGAGDLAGASVALFGTDYQAQADAAGAFTIAHLPAGTFALDAHKSGLGRAHLDGLVVKAGAATDTGALALAATAPTVTAADPPNAAAGMAVAITGKDFGSEEPLGVSFGGVAAVSPLRQDDHTLIATVPVGAKSGDLIVAVDGVAGAPLPFKVVGALTIVSEIHAMVPGESHRLYAVASDTAGRPVPGVAIDWQASGAAVDLDASGTVQARGTGQATLVAKLGSLSSEPYTLGVYADPAVVSTLAGVPTAGDAERDPQDVPAYEGTGSAVEFGSPSGIALGPDGNLYVADGGGRVLRVSQDGVVQQLAAVPNARAIALGPDHQLYVAADTTVQRVGLDGKVTAFASSGFIKASALAFGPDGALYVVDDGAVKRATAGQVATLPAPVQSQGALCFGLDGKLYLSGQTRDFLQVDVTDPAKPVVKTMTVPHLDPGSRDTVPDRPYAMVAEDAGHLLFSDPGQANGYLRRLDFTDPDHPTVETVCGYGGWDGHLTADGPSKDAGFQWLHGLAYDAATRTLFATEEGYDHSQQRVRRISLAKP